MKIAAAAYLEAEAKAKAEKEKKLSKYAGSTADAAARTIQKMYHVYMVSTAKMVLKSTPALALRFGLPSGNTFWTTYKSCTQSGHPASNLGTDFVILVSLVFAAPRFINGKTSSGFLISCGGSANG